MTTISPNSGAHLTIATTTKILAGLTDHAMKSGQDLSTYANEVLSIGAEHPPEKLRAALNPESESDEKEGAA